MWHCMVPNAKGYTKSQVIRFMVIHCEGHEIKNYKVGVALNKNYTCKKKEWSRVFFVKQWV